MTYKHDPCHAGDCAVHNPPAYTAGPCDCGVDASRSQIWNDVG